MEAVYLIVNCIGLEETGGKLTLICQDTIKRSIFLVVCSPSIHPELRSALPCDQGQGALYETHKFYVTV